MGPWKRIARARSSTGSTLSVPQRRGMRQPGRISRPAGRPKTAARTRLFTRTKPKKKQLFQGPSKGHNETYSKTVYQLRTYNKRLNKLKRALTTASQGLYNGSVQLVVTAGIQNACSFYDTTHSAEPRLGAVGEITAYGSALPLQISKFQHESSTLDAIIRNAENQPVRVTLYDVVPRHDIISNAQGATDLLGAFQTGLTAEAGASGIVDANYTTVGITPFQNINFVNNWKIIKVTSLLMNPGEVHRHKIKYKCGKTYNKLELTQENATMLKYEGVDTLIIAHGTPETTTAGTNPTTGKALLDIVWTKKVKNSYINNNNNQVYAYANNLSTVGPVGGIDPESGLPIADATF
nr:MAG: capsid protein [Cressdnaviricota sp.]